MSDNGTMKPRKPQLSESIERLDEMVTELSTAIPAAVGESVREALGSAFAVAVKDAVKAAVAEALKELAPAVAAPPAPVPVAPPAPARKSLGSAWAKVKAVLGRLRQWASRAAAPVLAHAALGWMLAKLIGAATVRSRVAALVTALGGAAAGLVGFALGPIGAAALLALAASSITATAIWAAPTISLFVALRDD